MAVKFLKSYNLNITNAYYDEIKNTVCILKKTLFTVGTVNQAFNSTAAWPTHYQHDHCLD
jgi:hypothetical protein